MALFHSGFLFLSTTPLCVCVCVCVCVHARHIFFICSSVEGHLDFPSVLPIVNSVAVNIGGYPGGSVVKNLPAMQETQVWSLSQEDPLEKGMATHSSIPVWRIPHTQEPGGLPSMGLQRVGHD